MYLINTQRQYTKFRHLITHLFNRKSLILSETTPYETIAICGKSSIRYYASANQLYKEPIVFIAPLAISMAIYDLLPYRSLIRFLQTQGFEVYLIDWGNLGYGEHNLDFLYFIKKALPEYLQIICTHSNSKYISLHGWSMSGIFALLYTASHKANPVKNLIILGSPIDTYASGKIGKLYKTAYKLFSSNKNFNLILKKVPNVLIHTPGYLNSLGFKLLNPKAWITSHIQFFNSLGNKKHLQEHVTLRHFLNHMIDYPGGVNKDMIFNIWLQNSLSKGSIQLENTTIELKNIHASLLIGAGTHDHLISASAVQPLKTLTNSQDVTFQLIPGGHLGLISNQASAKEFWPKLKNWLAERSTPIK